MTSVARKANQGLPTDFRCRSRQGPVSLGAEIRWLSQVCSHSRYNKDSMADDKLYKSVSMGSGTFLITKPKRKAAKRRQSALKHPRRGARK